MSEEKKETVSDIVAEMRDEGHTGDASCLEWIGTKMRHYADRIEAAYNRLAIPTPKQWTEIAQKLCENVLLERENARLRAALKPVLEVDMSHCVNILPRCHAAVAEARRIYNGDIKPKGTTRNEQMLQWSRRRDHQKAVTAGRDPHIFEPNRKETKDMNDETNEAHEPSLDAATVISIARHYCHAKDKHPYFADRLCLDEADAEDASIALKCASIALKCMRAIEVRERTNGKLHAETLARCEIAEVAEALARGDKAQAVSECYDTIAVMLRIIDVLEGRQALGKPKTADESEAKE